MKNRTRRIPILILLFASIFSQSFSQENAAFQQPGLDYRLAGETDRFGNAGSARQLYHEIASGMQIDDPDMVAGTLYGEAVSAARLTNPDAEAKLGKFIDEYPEDARMGEASLYLGKLYFNDNKFRDAITSLQKVNVAGLSKDGREELFFMIGYSELKTGDISTAKAYLQRISNTKSPYYYQSKYFLAHIDFTQKNYEKALAGFREIKYDRRYEKVVPLYEIQIYHYLGDYDKIMASGPDLIESAGNNNKAEIARITGNAFFNAGDYQNASKYFGIFEKTNRKSLTRDDHYLMGFVDFMAGDYKNAIPDFQKAIKQDDAMSQNASYYLGNCYNETGQKNYAANAFLAAYKNNIDAEIAEEALFNYVKISLESPGNPYNESISLLETYLNEHPGTARADEGYGYLSQLYLSSRNYKQALASIESAGKLNEKMKAAYQKILFYRAGELFNMQDYDGALELYSKASGFTYDEMIRSEALYWAGEVFYLQKNYWAAIKYYKDFLASKMAKKSSLYATAFYNLGYAHFNRKEYGEAITQLTKYLELSQGSDAMLASDAYTRLGDACFISKQYDKAIYYYDRVIMNKGISTDYAIYHKALAEGAKGDFNRKIDAMKVLINNYPSSSYHDDAYYETALAYVLLNQENQALTYFDKLTREYPSGSKALQASLRMGFIYFNRSDYDKAISSFKNVIEKFPGTQEAQEALAALKNLYYEKGEIDQYYAYAKGLTFAEINATEEDSLNYEVAENLYMQGKCQQAVSAFDKYLAAFPNGSFTADALYYQADCYLKSNQNEAALQKFIQVAEKPRSRYTEPALATASAMEFSAGNWTAALPLFEQLETVAEDPDNITASIAGQMRCHYRTNNDASAILAAQKLIGSGKASPGLTDEAHFVLGQSYLRQGDLTEAEKEFSITAKMTGTEWGAIASYNLADIQFRAGQLAEAEQRVYKLAEDFSAYDYWVAKGFILLSDIFVKNGNVFQARETLKSVIDNYQGPELGDMARQKLSELPVE